MFCINGFASASCMANIYLSRFMMCNLMCTLIIKCITFVLSVGRGSSFGIATRYGRLVQFLNPAGPRFSAAVLGPTQPSIRWILGLPRGQKFSGIVLTIHPTYGLCQRKSRFTYIAPKSRPLLPITHVLVSVCLLPPSLKFTYRWECEV